MDQLAFGTNDFAGNPEPRVPCVLVLDVSGSMAGNPINELNEGLLTYKDELTADSLASKRVEVAIVTFGAEVKTEVHFTTADGFIPPTLETSGMTPMGQAVNLAIDLIEGRKQEYRENGVSFYRPWLFLVSDGAPNDPGWEVAAQRAVDKEKAKAMKIFCVGVDGANLSVLSRFSVAEPLMLKGLRFRDMFLWLSSSQKSVSRSTPGDEVPLENPTGPEGWGSI
ncbi:MAG: VWA domain-containing protein [Planctomycetota bacterium]|nr:VWA domain-containing protein [Planctomycetota bacterium]